MMPKRITGKVIHLLISAASEWITRICCRFPSSVNVRENCCNFMTQMHSLFPNENKSDISSH